MAISKTTLLATLLATACASGAPPRSRADGTALTLTSPEGRNVTLDDLRRDRVATALIFWSTACPCVRRYQERVDSLLDRYPADQVRIVGVSSNAGESFAEVLQVAKQRGVRLPIFRDESGEVARAVGAQSTPTVAVFDGRGELRFLGWIDNERQPGDPKREPWLELALQGLVEQRSFAARTPVYGCTITRSLFGSSPGPCCHDQHESRTPP